jgi:hypothetical protein
MGKIISTKRNARQIKHFSLKCETVHGQTRLQSVYLEFGNEFVTCCPRKHNRLKNWKSNRSVQDVFDSLTISEEMSDVSDIVPEIMDYNADDIMIFIDEDRMIPYTPTPLQYDAVPDCDYENFYNNLDQSVLDCI